MADVPQSRWRRMSWVIPASVVLHALVVAIFFLPDAVKQPEPAPEENVSVELVPPPEEKQPEAPKPPEPKAEEKKPEEKKPEPPKPPEKPPEPPKTQQPADQPKAEEPPPPPPPAPAKPPEPPKPPEAPKPPEPPKPQEEKPPEPPKPEADKPNAEEQPAKSLLQPLKPVFRYGDKDSGPEKSDGDSAEGDPKAEKNASADDTKPDPAPAKPLPTPEPPVQSDASDKPPEDKPAEAPADKPVDTPLTADKPSGAGPLPPDINLPQVDADDSHAEKNGAPGDAPDNAKVSFAQGLSPEQAKQLADAAAHPPTPEAKPAQPTPSQNLTKVKKLFSQTDGAGAVAMTAMGSVPRGVRIGQLCATELREQLRHSPMPPEILPAYRLPGGNVLDVPRSQFRSMGEWYNLSFRCEVDGDGTKVVSFAYKVGDAVPRSQWRSRGFPEN